MSVSQFSPSQRAHYTSQQNGAVSLILRSAPLTGAGVNIKSITLPVNPEGIDIKRPSRQSVTQTLGGAWQDHWGEALIRVNISGSTGWRPRTPSGMDGYESIKLLRDVMHEYDKRVVETGIPMNVYLYLLMDLPDGWERFRVSKESAGYTRSRSRPLLYFYELSFIAIEDLSYMEKTDVSPTFIISSYPLKPPPVASDPGNAGGGDGPSSGDGPPGGGIDPNTALNARLRQLNLEADANDAMLSSSTDATVFAGESCLTDDYYYVTTTCPPSLSGLAAMWYPDRGWSRKPYLLWPFIRDANPTIFSSSSTGDTPVRTTTDIHDESYKFQPTKIFMPYLDPAPWSGNAESYANRYLSSLETKAAAVRTQKRAASQAASTAAALTAGWNLLSDAVQGGVNALTAAWATGSAQQNAVNDPFYSQPPKEPIGSPPALNSMGPS